MSKEETRTSEDSLSDGDASIAMLPAPATFEEKPKSGVHPAVYIALVDTSQ
jgi:hypothetical protein